MASSDGCSLTATRADSELTRRLREGVDPNHAGVDPRTAADTANTAEQVFRGGARARNVSALPVFLGSERDLLRNGVIADERGAELEGLFDDGAIGSEPIPGERQRVRVRIVTARQLEGVGLLVPVLSLRREPARRECQVP